MKKLIFAVLAVLFSCLYFIGANAQCLQLINLPADTSVWLRGGNGVGTEYDNDTIIINQSIWTQNNYIYNSFPVSLMGIASTFSASFDFRIDQNSSCSDGLVFWFLSSPLTQLGSNGLTGHRLGFPDTTNGFALVLKTLGCNNRIFLKSINSTNYSFNENNDNICTPLQNQTFVTDEQWHHVVLNYEHGNITASFDGGVTTLIGYAPISGTGHFGFMATTGAGTSRKSLKNIQVCADLGTPTTSSTNFGNFINRQCNGPLVTTVTFNYSASHNLKTYWGDGTMTAATSFQQGMTGGYVQQSHNYPAAGTYTIRQELYSGITLIDTMTYEYENIFCATLPVKFYYDNNTDCMKQPNESFITQPVLVEVDSNGFPVDTISTTSGFYYDALGNVGDVYTFKVIDVPGNMYVSCPLTAEISQTLTAGVFVYPIQYMALNCSSGNDFDFAITAETPVTGAYDQWGNIYLTNAYCAPANATVTMSFSPKYVYTGGANPPPTSTTLNTLTWNVSNLSAQNAQPTKIYFQVWNIPGQPLAFGDTVQCHFNVSPTTGDMNTANNMTVIVDTVESGCDPNYIEATPECTENVTTPQTIRYTIHFENTGNDTTRNIYVLDTIPNSLNPSSLKIVSASHAMNFYKYQAAGYTILKFDFPWIQLLDSSHHGQCTGYVSFDIKTSTAMPYGSNIQNRAGIYFDGNPVVLTNTFMNRFGFCSVSANVGETTQVPIVSIYPNPATTSLTIKSEHGNSCNYVITNSIGQELLTGKLNNSLSYVDIKAIPAGIYYITLTSSQGKYVEKLVKW